MKSKSKSGKCSQEMVGQSKKMRKCPAKGCNIQGSIQFIDAHLRSDHNHRSCPGCGLIMAKASISRHKKNCKKVSSPQKPPLAPIQRKKNGLEVITKQEWDNLQAQTYIDELNNIGGQRWSRRTSSTSRKGYKYIEWVCFWKNCPGRCVWTSVSGFRHYPCCSHANVSFNYEKIPKWLSDSWRRKAREGVNIERMYKMIYILQLHSPSSF